MHRLICAAYKEIGKIAPLLRFVRRNARAPAFKAMKEVLISKT
jgi:hypothetical protein